MSEKSTTWNNEGLMFENWLEPQVNDWDDELEVQDEKKPKLDIFLAMKNADLKNMGFLEEQSQALQDSFSPLIAMRWFSSISDSNAGMRDYHLILTNEVVNMNFWVLREHKELQWKLMAACGTGKVQRHQWINMSKRKTISKVNQYMLKWYPWANEDELKIITNDMNRDDFENFVKSTGAPNDELKDALAIYDQETGSKPEKARKAKK